jgi:excisionase family DNA binding protein
MLAIQKDWVDEVVSAIPPIATVKETLNALRVSRRTFYRLVAKGAIKTVRPTEGGTSPHLVPRAEIARYLRGLEVGAANERA